MPSPQEVAAALGVDPVQTAVPLASEQYPGSVQGTANALMGVASLPKQAFEQSESLRQGGDYNAGPVTQAASLLMGGGMPMAEAGAAGIFGGKLAKGADLLKLNAAKVMEGRGAHPAEVWRQTGWGRGADGQWRFEIPDYGVKVDPSFQNEKGTRNTWLGDLLPHPGLYKNYPDLAHRTATIYDKMPAEAVKGAETVGAYLPRLGSFEFKRDALNKEGSPLVLHEVQHAIQQHEGFPIGARHMGGTEGLNQDDYIRAASEVEARNVEKRSHLIPDILRHAGPWATEDVMRPNQLPGEVIPRVDPYQGVLSDLLRELTKK